MKLRSLTAAVLLGILTTLAAGLSAPAIAEPDRTKKTSDVSPMWERTDVVSTNVNMRACASTSGCSVLAQANPGQEMVAHCSEQTTNGYWDIVYNRSLNRVGFIKESLLTGFEGGACTSGLPEGLTGTDANMRSCPSTSCTVSGVAYSGHRLYSQCYSIGQVINGNQYWDVVYNETTGRMGFITEYYLTDKTQNQQCYPE
jgi:hypothetical protein